MGFDDLIKERASVRKYSDKKPDVKDVIKCIEAANLAPSPGNLALIKYLIIEDEEKIDQIADACQQRFISQAKVLVLFLTESKDVETMYDKRGRKYLKQHVGAAAQNFLLEITNLGLASCWVGAFSDLTMKNILSLPDTVEIEAIFTVGYQSKTDKTSQRRKPNVENRLFFHEFRNKNRKQFTKISD